jgi:peptide/nickel transport system substrate-binding protein
MPYPFLTNSNISRRSVIRGGVLGAAGLTAAALIGCGDDDEEEAAPAAPAASASPAAQAVPPGGTPKAGGEISTIFFRARTSWDPHRATSPIQTQDHWGLVGNSLIVPDPETMLATGDLIKEWEWFGDTTLLGRLDEAAKWQNVKPVMGRKFTAKDAAFNIDRIATRAWSPRQFLFSTLDSVDVVDDNTVQFNLNQPDANFLDSLASLYNAMVAPEVAAGLGDDLNSTGALIGTGPFISESHEDGVGGRYVKNPDYWREGKPYLDAVEYQLVKDDSVQFAMFKAGKIDGPARVYPNSFGVELMKDDDLTVWHSGGEVRGYGGICFAVQKEPFNDERLRHAVHLAHNRQQMIEIQNDGYASLMTPGGRDPSFTIPDSELLKMPGYRVDKTADIAEAAKLVQAATGGSLKLTYHTGQNYAIAAELVQGQLAEIGIETTLKVLPKSGIVTTEQGAANPDFVVQSTTRGGGDTVDHSFLQTFHPSGSQNPYGIDDPTLTAMIDKQRQILDLDARKEAYQEIEHYILDKAYIAPGVRGQGFMFWKSDVKGYRPGLSGGGNVKAHLFEELWLDR